MIDTDSRKRFRKRGGAKKKKKPSIAALETTPHEASVHDGSQTMYISGFQEADTLLDAELLSYLRKLEADLEQEDPGAEIALSWRGTDGEDVPPSVLLARNALLELAPRMNEIARDNSAGRMVETLAKCAQDPNVTSEVLSGLLACGPTRLASLATHHCASHVFETLLNVTNACVDESESAVLAISQLSKHVSLWSAEDVLEMIHSAAGSHVFRTCMAVLSGLPNDEPREAKLDDSQPQKVLTYMETMRNSVPEEWLNAVAHVATTLLGSVKCSFSDMVWDTFTCAAIQSLLSAVSLVDRALAKRIAEEGMKAGFDELVQNPCGCRFVERVILVVGSSAVKSSMSGRLTELSHHPKANFCVQRMLLRLKGRGAVMSAWDELEDAVPNMIGFGKAREGVVLSLLRITEAEGDENCRRRASRCIARASGAIGDNAKMLAGALVMGSLQMWGRWQKCVAEIGLSGMGLNGREADVLRIPKRLPAPSLLGTLMARCLLRFPGGPGQVIRDSIAAFTDEEMLALLGDPNGSRLIEQWMANEDPERAMKIAGKIIRIISGKDGAHRIPAVARNPYGAMVIVKCTSVLGGPQRRKLMDVLASDINNLRDHDSGQMVIRKCRVEQYMKRGDEWEREESAMATKQRLFADILGDRETDVAEAQSVPTEGKKKVSDADKKRKKRKRTTQVETTGEDLRHGPGSYESVATDQETAIGAESSKLNSVLRAIEDAAQPGKKKTKKRKRQKEKA